MTFAEDWVNTYTYVENHRRAFINLGPLLKVKHMLENPHTYVFQENVVHSKIIFIDGIPHVQTRVRFIKALRQAGDNIPRLYITLNQIFKKDAIRILWPIVLLKWSNVMARKKNTYERNEKNRVLKKIPVADRKLHGEIVKLTQKPTLRSAKPIGNF